MGGILLFNKTIKNKKITMIQKKEIYERQDDGTLLLVGIEEYETPEEQLIQDKESLLLQIYAELEALKNNTSNNAN